MSIANIILELRKERNLTQKEFAEAVKINRSVINRIEKGTRPIRDDEVKNIANYFGVSTDYLLGNTNSFPLTINDDTSHKVVKRPKINRIRLALNKDEMNLVKAFRCMRPEDKELTLSVVNRIDVSPVKNVINARPFGVKRNRSSAKLERAEISKLNF